MKKCTILLLFVTVVVNLQAQLLTQLFPGKDAITTIPRGWRFPSPVPALQIQSETESIYSLPDYLQPDSKAPGLGETSSGSTSERIDASIDKKAAPVKIILDSDIGQDCDDAAVMALMHKFADAGEADILATMFPMQDPMGAPAMDVINTYYGRPDIPIGTYKGNYQYIGKLYDHYNTKLARQFPHDLKHGNDAPDAIALYRQILAKQPDKSVVIVVVGPERLVADLLKTGPDKFSKLSGKELVKKKVKLLSVMGAGFPKGDEWNVKIAPDASKLVAETWPTPIVYSGFEIGQAIKTGRRLLTETPKTNPVRAAYENHPFIDTLTRNRQSWDQTAMHFAVRGTSELWDLESNGYNHIDETGKNEWRRDADKDHSYLILKQPVAEAQKIIEDLMVASPARKR